ncbi:MAG: hypothetical protein R3F14_05995 [Polyangiaceae bacterium]
MILAISFLLVVSLVVTAGMRFLWTKTHLDAPSGGALWGALSCLPRRTRRSSR